MEYFFYSDNRSVLSSLLKTKVSGKLNCDLIRAANKLSNKLGKNLKFRWVKSHDGNRGNEYADELAREAATTGINYNVDMSLTYVKSLVKKKVNDLWNENWSNIAGCRQSKKLISFNPSKDNANFILGRNRIFCRQTIALLTGHNSLRYHTFLRNNASDQFSPVCRFCSDDVESSVHLMETCKALEARRRAFSPDNPKKGPDIASMVSKAIHLGIWTLVQEAERQEEESD